MHEIHTLRLIIVLVLCEIAFYIGINTYLLIRWMRYYWDPFHNAWEIFKTACNVVFKSEVRLYEFIPPFVACNILLMCGLLMWGIAWVLGFFGVKVSL